MPHVVYADGVKIPYELSRHPRCRRVTLRVFASGRVRFSVPPRATDARIAQDVRQHAAWLRRTWERAVEERRALPSAPQLGKGEEARHRAAALRLVTERLAHFNEVYGFRWTRVSVRNQRTRWGSCSDKGSLCFNWRLALLPPALADYVVVHELCHLGELNHSRRFWALVARSMPDHAVRRKALTASPLLD